MLTTNINELVVNLNEPISPILYVVQIFTTT
jgi:hypothetical protein